HGPTTRTGPTAASANAHPTTPKSPRTGPADRSDDTPIALDSSTSTAKQPEPPRQRSTHRQRRASTRARAPAHTPTRTPTALTAHPHAFPAPTRPQQPQSQKLARR